MQSKRILLVTLFALLVGTDGLWANYAFKKKVISVCNSYRITVESSQFSLGENDFSIDLESGRNNFEMVMLVGFAAAGHAIEHQIQMGKANAYTPDYEYCGTYLKGRNQYVCSHVFETNGH